MTAAGPAAGWQLWLKVATGVDCYLTKPASFQDLKDAVRIGLQGAGTAT